MGGKFIQAAFFIWCSVLSLISAAQTITQPIRKEMEIDAFKEAVEVIPMPDSALLLYRRPYFDLFKAKHVFQKFNQNLQQQWETTVDLEDNQEFHQYYATPDFTYFLYLDRNPGRFYILKINAGTGAHVLTKYNLKDFDIDRDVQLERFKVLDNQIFIMAYTTRNVLVLHLDQGTGQIKTIPALYDQLSAISHFHLDTASQRAEFVLAESNGIKGRLQVKRFSPGGDLYTNNFILPPFKKNFITGQLSPGDSATKIIIGSFNSRNLRTAEGIFSMPLVAPENKANFYQFIKLKHFFDFLGKGARRRLKQRAARYESKNKELRQHFRLLIQDLEMYRDTLYLFAEAYTPVTHNSNRYFNRITSYPLGMLNLPPRDRDMSPSEFRFSHSFVMAFDRKGNLLWDNNYVLEEATTTRLAPVAQHAFAGNKIVMAYAYEKDIRYKIIDRDSTSDNETSVPLEALDPEEKLSDPDNPDLKYWYGAHFITFGFQRVRAGNWQSREVFYLTKVSLAR